MSDNPRNHTSFALPEEEKKARLEAMRIKLEASMSKTKKSTKSGRFSTKGVRLLVYVLIITLAYLFYFLMIASYV
jgi:hypothetical protein